MLLIIFEIKLERMHMILFFKGDIPFLLIVYPYFPILVLMFRPESQS